MEQNKSYNNNNDGIISDAAFKLAEAINKVADHALPGRLSEIVKLHSGIAVGSAFIPVPGADIAVTIGNIWTMYVRINKEINLPFSENLIKSIATGIATNIGTGIIGIFIGSALKLIPGIGTMGGYVLFGSTVYIVTIASGVIYMNILAKLFKEKQSCELIENDLKEITEQYMKDKKNTKAIFQNAKKEYKEAKKNKEI